MTSFGDVRTPRGFASYCKRHPGQCSTSHRPAGPVVLTAESYRVLSRVNADVNRSVRYVSDRVLYGKFDFWTLPDGEGDCEDIALEKRRRLIALGYPSRSLLLTLAKTPRGNGHLVLVVVTDRGDYVMDNLEEAVVPWWSLGYSWLVQQSRDREMRWVALRTVGFANRGASAMPAVSP